MATVPAAGVVGPLEWLRCILGLTDVSGNLFEIRVQPFVVVPLIECVGFAGRRLSGVVIAG
jgi:hypothetical protein